MDRTKLLLIIGSSIIIITLIIISYKYFSRKCSSSCKNKQCGSDGCGGSCGTCKSGQVCSNNKCTVSPLPCKSATSCPVGLNCGTVSDNCGGSIQCGTCKSGEQCSQSQCIPNEYGIHSKSGQQFLTNGYYLTTNDTLLN